MGRDGSVLGGVVGEVFAPEGVLLLAYLAVRPDLRGRGVGTALVEHVAPRWYDTPPSGWPWARFTTRARGPASRATTR